ncbi:MAG: hypothetical protein ACK45B_09805 [Limisphaerales bacterium]
MNKPSAVAIPPTESERLALAREAFLRFHSRCFWFMRRDALITEREIPYICERLRADGGRPGFLLAARICP